MFPETKILNDGATVKYIPTVKIANRKVHDAILKLVLAQYNEKIAANRQLEEKVSSLANFSSRPQAGSSLADHRSQNGAN